MPRVIQVASSESHEGLTRVSNAQSNESSDSDELQNRNYNQRVNIINEPITTYLRFPVDYSLYNVTYTESENDPYCLRCVMGGEVKKFKKDARMWLHKSSERKRKLCDTGGPTMTVGNESGAIDNKNAKMQASGRMMMARGGTLKSPAYNMAVGNDLLSELSSLADSDADLTYSEESSPTIGASLVELRDKIQETKTVRFNECLNTGYRVHTISSDSEESLNAVSKTISKRNLPGDTIFIEEIDFDLDTGNESRNNVRVAPVPLDVSKIAPAISIETESYQESLLDYAVNLQNNAQKEERFLRARPRITDVGYSTLHATQMMLKMKARKNREDRARPYNLRSMRKPGQSIDQVVPSTRQMEKPAYCNAVGIKPANREVDVKPAVACMDLAFSRQSQYSDQMPSCSRDLDIGQKCNAVPTLFILAGRVLYKHMKTDLNKMT